MQWTKRTEATAGGCVKKEGWAIYQGASVSRTGKSCFFIGYGVDTSGGQVRGVGGILELRVQFPLSPACRAWPSLGPKLAAAAARDGQLGCGHSQSPSLSPGGRGLCKWDARPLAAAGTGSRGKVKSSHIAEFVVLVPLTQ